MTSTQFYLSNALVLLTAITVSPVAAATTRRPAPNAAPSVASEPTAPSDDRPVVRWVEPLGAKKTSRSPAPPANATQKIDLPPAAQGKVPKATPNRAARTSKATANSAKLSRVAPSEMSRAGQTSKKATTGKATSKKGTSKKLPLEKTPPVDVPSIKAPPSNMTQSRSSAATLGETPDHIAPRDLEDLAEPAEDEPQCLRLPPGPELAPSFVTIHGIAQPGTEPELEQPQSEQGVPAEPASSASRARPTAAADPDSQPAAPAKKPAARGSRQAPSRSPRRT